MAAPHRARSAQFPSELDRKAAGQLCRIIANRQPTTLTLQRENGESASITLLPSLAKPLLELLGLIETGKSVKIIPMDVELTTQEAADLLNVSRPYLIKLLENKELPYKLVGRHRRILAKDLNCYLENRNKTRAKALEALALTDSENDLI